MFCLHEDSVFYGNASRFHLSLQSKILQKPVVPVLWYCAFFALSASDNILSQIKTQTQASSFYSFSVGCSEQRREQQQLRCGVNNALLIPTAHGSEISTILFVLGVASP